MPAKNARYFKSDLTVMNLADEMADIASKIESICEALVVDKNVEVTLSGSNVELLAQQTISAPSTGTKTVTAIAAEAFAGSAVKPNRKKLIIKNEDAVLRFRVGAVDITQDKGFTVEPKAFVEFAFDPGTYVPIYIIAETADMEVEVYEE